MTSNSVDETKDWMDNLEKELQAKEKNIMDEGENTENLEDKMDVISDRVIDTNERVVPDSNRSKKKTIQLPRVECSKCGKTFTTKTTLKLHTKSVHLGIKEPCLFCAMTFSQITNMRTHMKKQHLEEWTKHKSFNRDKVEF